MSFQRTAARTVAATQSSLRGGRMHSLAAGSSAAAQPER
jgi:hypothetical protein